MVKVHYYWKMLVDLGKFYTPKKNNLENMKKLVKFLTP